MFRSFCILVLLISLSSTSDDLISRTGDIVLHDRLKPEVQFSWGVSGDSIVDNEIFDVLGRIYGTPRTLLNSEVELKTDIFDSPSKLALFSVEGIEIDEKTSNSYQIFGKNRLIDINPSYEPHNPFTLLSTVLTGVGPTVSGVTNRRWPQQHKPAYRTGNFFDAVSELRNERIVSASSTLDSANIVAPSVAHRNAFTFYWNAAKKEFVGALPEYTFGEKDFTTLIEKLTKVLEKRVVYSAPNVFIYWDEANPTAYDLLDEDDQSFIVELLFIVNAIDLDTAFFSFHFESPKNIKQKYGSDSVEYKTAISVLDAAISTYIKNSDSSLGYAIFYFPISYATPSLLTSIENLVKEHITIPHGMLPSVAFRSYFPHIFLSSTQSVSNLCNELQSLLSEHVNSIELTCTGSLKRSILQSNASEPAPTNPIPGPESPTPFSPSSSPANSSNSTPGTASVADVALMHIVLWTVVALIIGLVVSCLQLAALDGSNEPAFKPKSYNPGRRGQTQKVQ